MWSLQMRIVTFWLYTAGLIDRWFLVWRRLAESSPNVAIHIQSDHIVRQTIMFLFWINNVSLTHLENFQMKYLE